MSKWESAYHRYRELESNWPSTPRARPLLRQLLHGARPQQWLGLYAAAGLDPVDDALLGEATGLRGCVEEAAQHTQPLEDAYQAALYMLRNEYWGMPNPGMRAYRGQRCPWPIVPKIFRGDSPEKVLSRDELKRRRSRLASFVEKLREDFPWFNLHQCIAIAQHYSVGTWLVDMTWDPLVALFFASLGGNSSDVGVIACFSRRDWQVLSAEGTNRLGAIRHIEAPGVPRMEAQKAVFLEGSHADLIEQYVAAEIRFHQKGGLTFEDPSRGITEDRLLSEDDRFAEFVREWKENAQELTDPSAVPLPENADAPLEAEDYRSMMDSWPRPQGASSGPLQQFLLDDLSRLHTRLQKEKLRVPIIARSLRRLRKARRMILLGQISTLRTAIRGYFEAADVHAGRVINQILLETTNGNGG